MSIKNLLTEKDYELIDAYREMFAVEGGNEEPSSPFVSSASLLNVWANEKDKFLAKTLFKDGLILSRPVEVSCDDLAANVPQDTYVKLYDYLYNFRKALRDSLNIDSLNGDEYYKLNRSLNILFDIDNLWNNVYTGPSIKIGRLSLQTGSKIMRVFQKLNKMYSLMPEEELEAFRILHSSVLNTSKLKGNLCLSIHPLDYMTMSDNANNWSSCMSWTDEGCYRLGTTEMMNSPYVVVAYLTSSTPFTFGNHEWNSKKWRCLFVVHNDIVTDVKSYPYYNYELTQMSINWLYELLNAVMPNHYNKPTTYTYPKLNSVEIRMGTDFMYNDFSYGNTNVGFLNKEISADGDGIYVHYSGDAQCMVCGKVNQSSYMFSENHLTCCDCWDDADTRFCDHCGERIDVDDALWVDDTCLCEECYNKLTVQNIITDSTIFAENAIKIIYIPKFLQNAPQNIVDEYIKYCYENEHCVYIYNSYVNTAPCFANGFAGMRDFIIEGTGFDIFSNKDMQKFDNAYEHRYDGKFHSFKVWCDVLEELGVDWGNENDINYADTFSFYRDALIINLNSEHLKEISKVFEDHYHWELRYAFNTAYARCRMSEELMTYIKTNETLI